MGRGGGGFRFQGWWDYYGVLRCIELGGGLALFRLLGEVFEECFLLRAVDGTLSRDCWSRDRGAVERRSGRGGDATEVRLVGKGLVGWLVGIDGGPAGCGFGILRVRSFAWIECVSSIWFVSLY